jgi:tetratricopeptide (TPR) repeat protein
LTLPCRTRSPGSAARVVLLALCASTAAAVGCANSPLYERGGGAPAGPSAADYYLQGMSAAKAGDREGAIRSLQQSVRLSPNFALAYSALGDLFKATGDYESAAKQYENVTRLDPYTADNHLRLGLSYHFLDRLREAAAAYLRAIKLNPTDWRSNMNLGLVYMALGNNNAAVEHAQRATNLNPLSAVAFANLGVTLDARGNGAEAEAAYRKALYIDPGHNAAALNLATNLMDRRRASEAASVLEKLVAEADSAPARRRLGDALAQSGRESEALQQYKKALSLDGRYYPAMNGMAALLITQYRNGLLLDDRKRDEAVATWRQSLQVKPDQPKVEAHLKLWAPRGGAVSVD